MSDLNVSPGSPLAIGWRRELADLLTEVGIADVLDAISAYAEHRARADLRPRRDLWERQTEKECSRPCGRRIRHTAVERGHCKL